MKRHVSHRTRIFLAFMVAAVLAVAVQAQSGKGGITGDWRIKVETQGRQTESILSLSQDANGKPTGKWISLWGVSDLNDLDYDNDQLTFSRTSRFRDRQTTTVFSGLLKGGKLVGTLSSDSVQSKFQGTRVGFVSQAAGSWDMTIKSGENEYVGVLDIARPEKGKLAAKWRSDRGEHEIADIKFKKPNLTFTRSSKIQDRQWESSFEGQVKGHTLTGAFKSDRGEMAAQGKRQGAALVGRWEFKIASESGERTQILKVYPDMSALYGPIAIEKVGLDGDTVTFKAGYDSGERTIEYSFAGTLKGKKLSGKLTSSRGERQVQASKIIFKPGNNKSSQGKKTFRKPDVIFVPTPEKVVDRMLELAQVNKDDLVYDLGCGDGRIVVTAAKRYGCRGVGYDISAQRVKESIENVKKNDVGELVRIERADVFTLDLSEASVITLYLLPQLNVKLIPQLEKLKDGTRIVSHDFNMKGVKPDKVVTIKDSEDYYGDHKIYLWTTPLKKKQAKSK